MPKIKDYESEMATLVSLLWGNQDAYFLGRESKRIVEGRLDYLATLVAESHLKLKTWQDEERAHKLKLKLNEKK